MRLFLFFLGLIFSNIIFSQNRLFNEVQLRKSYVSAVSKSVSAGKPEATVLYANGLRKEGNASFFIPDKKSIAEIILKKPELLTLEIPYGDNGELITVELFYKQPYTKNSIVNTNTGKKHQMNDAAFYRGVVRDESQSLVAISFFDGEVNGVVSTENRGQFDLGKTVNSDIHVIYNASTLPYNYNFKCGTSEESGLIEQIEEHIETRGPGDCVKIFFETSYSIFQNKGSVSNVQNYVNGFFNVVATLYDNESVEVQISEIFVWTTSDPFPTNDSGDALDFYTNYRTSFNGDLAQLLARTNNGNGGIAWLNVLCNNFRYSYSDINMNYSNFPNYSWTVMVVTHELGHNIGSNHTHWCGWPGGAIDNCYNTEGSCGPGPAPNNGGTIMSYCHLTNYGINFNNGFGTLPGNKIRERINVKQCLDECGVQCPTFVLTGAVQDVSCAGVNDGSVSLNTPNVGTQPFQYQWSNGATSQNIGSLPSGTYTVTITDAANCTGTASFTVIAPQPLNINAQQENISCFGLSDGIVTLVVNGGIPNYNYLWSNGITGNIAANLSAGTYTVTVTDFNSCKIVETFFITQPTALSINESIGIISCNADNDGIISATITGGTGGGFYAWSTGSTNSIITNLGPGTYSLTVTDANLCQASETYVLTEPDVISVEIETTPASSTLVADGTAQAIVSGGTPNYQYQWSNGATGQTITNLAVGQYNVTIKDQNGCEIVQYFSIEAPDCQLSVNITTIPLTCNGGNNGSATADITNNTGNITFQWSNGAQTQTITSLAAGSYTVTVTDSECAVIRTVTISSPPPLTLTTTFIAPTCNNSDGSITVNVNGGTNPYAYQWSNGATTQTATNLNAGTYIVTVTDQNQCSTVTTQVLIGLDSQNPSLINDNVTVFLDENGNVNIDSIPSTFFFSDNCAMGGIKFQTNSFSCAELGSNTILVNGYDLAGNDIDASITVNVTDTIAPQIICPSDMNHGICQGVPIWNDIIYSDNCLVVNVEQISGFSLGTIFPLGETINTFLVTDQSGNESQCSFKVNVTEGLALNMIFNDMSCHNVPNGSAEVDVTNLTAPYSINWSNGATTAAITNLSAGLYTVSVTDGNGCHTVMDVVINNPEPISMNILNIKNASSSAASDGAVNIEVIGGTPGFSFEWTLGGAVVANIQNPQDLKAGVYKLVVTDSKGCVLVGTEITVGISLSSNNWKKDPITIFPSPADQMIYVRSKDIQNSSISVFDVLGRKIESANVMNKDSYLINTSTFTNGTYIIKVEQKDQWFVTKFVVRH